MITTTLFENGNEYQLTYKKVEAMEPAKEHFTMNGEICQIVSKVQVNEITITEEMSTMPLKRPGL